MTLKGYMSLVLGLTIAGLLVLASFALAVPVREPAEVVLKSRSELDALIKLGVDIDKVLRDVATVYVTPDEFDQIKDRGLQIGWIPNRAKLYADSLWQATKGTAHLMAAYHTYDELVADLDSIANAHPALCRLDSIGASVQGRGLWFMKISDNVNVEEDEPEFKYISTMHGDEVVGMEMCYYLIEYLVNNYGSDSLATFLVDETEIWIMPLMNPDGNALHQRYNANGVDLNRDFPDFVTDPNNTPSGREPETQVIMNWQFEHYSIQSANFHGGALVVNYPWDSTWDYNPDDTLFRDISLTYSRTNLPMWNSSTFEHGIVRGVEWYLIHGGMQDWNYYWMGCNEVTIELGDKWPPASTLPDYWDDNRESMLNYMARVHDGVRGVVTDASSGLPVAAAVEVDGIDHQVYTDPDMGDYHRMLLPGTYDLNFSAIGYSPLGVKDVVVASESTTVLNVQLYAQALGHISGTVTEAGTGNPLAASVEVLGSGFGPVTSDSLTGEYDIDVYEGLYTMEVSKDGYATVKRDSVVVSGSIVEDFELSPLAEYLYVSYDSVAIPDDDPVGIYSILNVPDSFQVEDLNVYVDITHTYIGDLKVALEDPQGFYVYLHDQGGGSNDDIKTWYDTETEPVGDLSDLTGRSSKGDWRLWVSDNAGWDTGTLNLWKLQLYGGGDLLPPATVVDLSASLSGSSIALSWSPVTDDQGLSHYVIYRSSDPYFQPQASDSIGWTDQTTFEDQDSPVGSTGVNGYYVVKAVDVVGNKSNSSNRVGEFDKALGEAHKGRKKFKLVHSRG